MFSSLASAAATRVVPATTERQPRKVSRCRRAAPASGSAGSVSMPSSSPTSSIRRLSSPPRSPSRRSTALAAASGEVSTATKPFELHVGPTTLSLPFNDHRASELRAALSVLLNTFAEKAKAERPKRWQSLEYRFGSDDGGETPPGIAFFEVFCNPNSAASPFDAKVLVTVKSTNGGVGFTTEAPLSALRADLEAFCSR